MSRTQRYACVWFLLIVGLATQLRLESESAVEGDVADEMGPVGDALVGWQAGRTRIRADSQGRFRLPASSHANHVVAHRPGYRLASLPGNRRWLSLRLDPLPSEDNDGYAWIDPHPDPTQANNCANCHGEIYREWKGSAHARSATNPKFLQLFAGAPNQKSWNARADHPDGSAVCASCHAPTLTSPTLDYDVRTAEGVTKSGIHCDYCHKVADVTDKLGTRFGRDALFLLRPKQGDTLTFGPLDDAVRSGESFAHAPVYKESRYCASCHEGTVFGVHAYGTYSEWLESPAGKLGRQCQDCHMAPTGKMTNIAPGKGGVERGPLTLASHHTPGGEPHMLKRALTLTVRPKAIPQGQKVDVDVVAVNVGHRVPTGFVDRQVILVVTARDAQGRRVESREGQRLPKSAGKWSGLAGTLYAKQLHGENERTPIPFWRVVFRVDDTRLYPERPEQQSFTFPAEARDVTVQLWYRRFWQEVADARSWTDNDFLIHDRALSLTPAARKR